MATGRCWAAVVVLVGAVCCGGCSIAWPPDQTGEVDSPADAAAASSSAELRQESASQPEPLLGAVLAAATEQAVTGHEPEPSAAHVPPVQAAEPAPVSPAAAPSSLDLLTLVDLQRDSLSGSWSREGTAILTPAESRAVLMMPHTPPGDYRWSLVLERLSGFESLNLCLTVASQQTMAVLEGFGGSFHGLNMLDGRSANQNASTSQGRVFQEATPCTVECTVRRSSPADWTIQVTCDGQTIIDWTGSPGRLTLDRRFWAQIPSDRLAIAIYDGPNARFRISRMELEPLESSLDGTPLPPLAQTPPAAQIPPPPLRGGPPFPPRPGRGPSGMPSAARPDSRGLASRPQAEPPEAAVRRKASVALIDHPLGAGTGFVVGDNLLATNAHVIGGSFVHDLDVHFANDDDRRYRATRVVYVNEVCDLAVLEISGMEQEPIPLAADLAFQRGREVVIIGNPSVGGGIMARNAVMQGTVTALMRIRGYDFYQIEAAVNPGSSGGPVLNSEGELIAVVAMKATDRGANEIRSALRQLDESFRAHFDPFGRKGLAFGVPGGALHQALQQVQSQSDDQANRIHDQHLAKSLFGRLATLGAVYLLEMQVNVAPEVRQQAFQARRSTAVRRSAGPQMADLIPPNVADALRRQLNTDEVRSLVRVCSADVDERVEQLQNSGRADSAVLESLAGLLRTVKSAQRAAEAPPSYYQAYSKTLLGLSGDLKRHIERLEKQLAVERSALEDS